MESMETTSENVIRLMGSHKYKTLDLNSDDNEAAIREFYQQMINGWNADKGYAFAAPHTDDTDFIGSDGIYMKGYQQIATFHQMLFECQR
jgi:cold shock CspA family protein